MRGEPNPTRTSVVTDRLGTEARRPVEWGTPIPAILHPPSPTIRRLSRSRSIVAGPFGRACFNLDAPRRAWQGRLCLASSALAGLAADPAGGQVAHNPFAPSRRAIFSARAARFASRSGWLGLHVDRDRISKRLPAPITTTSVPTCVKSSCHLGSVILPAESGSMRSTIPKKSASSWASSAPGKSDLPDPWARVEKVDSGNSRNTPPTQGTTCHAFSEPASQIARYLAGTWRRCLGSIVTSACPEKSNTCGDPRSCTLASIPDALSVTGLLPTGRKITHFAPQCNYLPHFRHTLPKTVV